MDIIQRVKNITLTPQTEWQIIEPESTSINQLFTSYIIPLSLIPALASFIGMALFGISMPLFGNYKIPMMTGLSTFLIQFGVGLAMIFVLSLIIDALAPTFGGQKNPTQALKVIAYAYTPAWVFGIINLIPSLSILGILAGLYSIYVLYLGLPILMKVAKEKAIAMTAAIVVSAIVMGALTSLLVSSVIGVPTIAQISQGNLFETNANSSSPIAAIEELNQYAKKMEEIQKDANVKMDVVEFAKLKELLPETISNLRRTSIEGEKTALGEMQISKAEAKYSSDDNKRITVSITDMGGSPAAKMMLGIAMIESERDTEELSEKTHQVDGRYTKELFRKNTQTGEYSVLVAGRFHMEIKGEQVTMDDLKMAAQTIGFTKLDAMKNSGVK